MPLPRDSYLYHYIRAYNALDLLNDKLCYIKEVNLEPFESDDMYFEIWMLNEYGMIVKESWEKIFKFGPIGSLEWETPPCVLGFSKNGEFLLLGDRYGYGPIKELYLSNFDAREEEEHLELPNPNPLPSKFVCYNKIQNPNPFLLEFVWYNESLVSVKKRRR